MDVLVKTPQAVPVVAVPPMVQLKLQVTPEFVASFAVDAVSVMLDPSGTVVLDGGAMITATAAGTVMTTETDSPGSETEVAVTRAVKLFAGSVVGAL